MSTVLIQIVERESAYLVRLKEETGETTESLLPRDSLVRSVWSPDAISERVGNVGPHERDHLDFHAIAATLYRWLLPSGPVRDRWKVLEAALPRLQLDIEPKELASLPWELTGTDNLALTNGMYRLTKAEQPPLQVSSWPFRILLVIGAPPEEQEALGIEEEIREIERVFLPLGRSVDVHRLDRPNKNGLMDWVKVFHPHVLHFAGHGGTLPGAEEGGLRIEPPGKDPWIWTGTSIRTDLRTWRWTPRFVFLNACRSAVEHQGTRSVQHGFLGRGTQAVLGMQGDIHGGLAGQFAGRLYSNCAEGMALEDATFEARAFLSARLPSVQHVDWALPSLTCATPKMRLVEPLSAPDTPEFRSCREFTEARLFADCREPRRKFTHWLFPAVSSDNTQRNVLLVKGDSKSGKSHLLKWCMETWALGGARVRYVELYEQSRTLLDVLRQIRKGETDGSEDSRYLHEPLPAAAFRRFRWELKNILEKSEPGEWIESEHLNDPEIGDDNGVLPANSDKRLEPMICARFGTALKAAAGTRPLVLVFDRLGGPNNERTLFAPDFVQLIDHLFLPIAQDRASNVKLAFGATLPEWRDYKLDRLAGDHALPYEVPVDFPEEKLVELAAEAVFFRNEKDVRELARIMLRFGERDRVGLGRLNSIMDFIMKRSDFAEIRMR